MRLTSFLALLLVGLVLCEPSEGNYCGCGLMIAIERHFVVLHSILLLLYSTSSSTLLLSLRESGTTVLFRTSTIAVAYSLHSELHSLHSPSLIAKTGFSD